MKTETIGTEIKIEAGKGKLVDGYQDTIELGKNNAGGKRYWPIVTIQKMAI